MNYLESGCSWCQGAREANQPEESGCSWCQGVKAPNQPVESGCTVSGDYMSKHQTNL